jgi:hypothetical protein
MFLKKAWIANKSVKLNNKTFNFKIKFRFQWNKVHKAALSREINQWWKIDSKIVRSILKLVKKESNSKKYKVSYH